MISLILDVLIEMVMRIAKMLANVKRITYANIYIINFT